jgi:hypothetical protein
MRTIVQQGGKYRHLLEPRRQKLRELLEGMANKEAVRLYGEYARMQVASEKRVTYKLPLNREDEGRAEEEELLTRLEARKAAELKELSEERDMQQKEPIGQTGATRDVGETPAENVEMMMMLQTAVGSGLLTVEEALEEQALINEVRNRDAEMEDAPIVQSIETQPTIRDTEPSPSPQASQAMPAGTTCDKHTTADTVCTMTTIQNFDDFPLKRFQEVQAQYYPSTLILAMQIHRDDTGSVTQVTADIADGSVDQLQINNPRFLAAIGVHLPPYDSILLQPEPRVDETYKIRILPGQRRDDPKAYIVGDLIPARHAFLHWLDSRRSADPKGPPTAAEARMLARKIGRRGLDVMSEIMRYWKLEQGSGGKHYRENRAKYLGEDPSYTEDPEVMPRNMWM